MTTFGHRWATPLRTTRRWYSSTVTRRGFRRQTPPSRSASPQGANTSRESSAQSRTATAVAVSGQVATPSAAEIKDATSTPNLRWYQRWTAAWFLASQVTSGRCAAESVQLDLPGVAQVEGIVEGQVDVLDSGGIEVIMQAIPHQVAQYPAADPPVRRRAGASGTQHAHHPGTGPNDCLELVGTILRHGGTLLADADNACPLHYSGQMPSCRAPFGRLPTRLG